MKEGGICKYGYIYAKKDIVPWERKLKNKVSDVCDLIFYEWSHTYDVYHESDKYNCIHLVHHNLKIAHTSKIL